MISLKMEKYLIKYNSTINTQNSLKKIILTP